METNNLCPICKKEVKKDLVMPDKNDGCVFFSIDCTNCGKFEIQNSASLLLQDRLSLLGALEIYVNQSKHTKLFTDQTLLWQFIKDIVAEKKKEEVLSNIIDKEKKEAVDTVYSENEKDWKSFSGFLKQQHDLGKKTIITRKFFDTYIDINKFSEVLNNLRKNVNKTIEGIISRDINSN